MNTSWENTRRALKNFSKGLVCNKCGNEPINLMRYNTCGHFFCKNCIENNSECAKCGTPVRPTEICNDHLIESLISSCNSIAEIIQEKDIWNTSSNILNASHISTIISNSGCKGNKNYIPQRNINKPNANGETRLHVACLKNQEDYVRLLLAAGANPNTKDNAHWTPLQEVVSYGYTNMCRLLLECGAAPNIPGRENRTALHEAAMYNRVDIAEMLLKYSAKKNVFDKHGKKPIDYCTPFEEMWNILKEEMDNNETYKEVTNLDCTLNQSSFLAHSPFVIYASNLSKQNKELLQNVALKHKMKITHAFGSSVTHVVVEANTQNIAKLSYDVMVALLRGTWLLNSEWIQLVMDLDDVQNVDLELFEISGTPIQGVPKKARENAQNQKPGLFNQCHFYFALRLRNTYYINEVEITVDRLAKLITEGNGKVLSREPKPEDIENKEEIVPFHIADEPFHPLYKCIYYIIYVPGEDEPRIKYNMPHIKTLPLTWLIECIEKFTLVDPSYLGLL